MLKFFNKAPVTPLLRWAVPNDTWELVLEFENGELRFYSGKAEFNTQQFTFLAFPHQFRQYVFSPRELVWNPNKKLDHEFLYKNSLPVTNEQLNQHSMLMGAKNGTPEDPSHCFNLRFFPFRKEKAFMLCEYVGDGVEERGGCAEFSVKELLAYEGWKKHFINAGCEWAVSLILSDENTLVQTLTEAARKHFPFG